MGLTRTGPVQLRAMDSSTSAVIATAVGFLAALVLCMFLPLLHASGWLRLTVNMALAFGAFGTWAVTFLAYGYCRVMVEPTP